MKAVFTNEKYVGVSDCDSASRMSIPATFETFQDIAAQHAELLGVGGLAMQKRNLFWVTLRTRIHFYRRPYMTTQAQVTTWPVHPGINRADRFYRMSDSNGVLAEGRTEWCVLNTTTGRSDVMEGVFDESIDFSEEMVLPAPYARFSHDFTAEEEVYAYKVMPSDIDLGRHMNNVAYVRMILNSFTVKELYRMNVSEMEILFMSPCFEGETLKLMRRKTESGYIFGICHEDGKYAALSLINVD